MAAARHLEGGDAVEERGAGRERDELAGGVVDVRIDLVFFGHHPAVAEHAVFRVEDHVAAEEVVRHHRGDADAQVHVRPVLDQAAGVLGDAGAAERGLAVVETRLVGRPPLAPLPEVELLGRRHHARHEDAGQVDQLRRNDAGLHDLVHLDDGHPRGLGEARVEVLAAPAELHVAETVGAIAPEERVVHVDRVLEDVRLAVEFTGLLARRQIGPDAGRRIEGRYARAARTTAFYQDALRHELDRHLAGANLLFAGRRRARSHGKRRDQLLDLLVLGKHLAALGARIPERITHETQFFGALVAQRAQEARRETMADAESRDCYRRAIRNIRNRFLRRINYLIH